MPAKRPVKKTSAQRQRERIEAYNKKAAEKKARKETKTVEEKNLLSFLRAFGVNANAVKSKKRSKNSVTVVIATSPFVRYTFQISKTDIAGEKVRHILPRGKKLGTKKEQQQILFALQHPKATQKMLPGLKAEIKKITGRKKVVRKSTQVKASQKLKGKRLRRKSL
ncbi:MAG: hypothetical protein HOC95_04770 [Candidatus Diapherotrites archaeon]|nr:hypothetical protein [Candidatus Diapherotrites archaeon]